MGHRLLEAVAIVVVPLSIVSAVKSEIVLVTVYGRLVVRTVRSAEHAEKGRVEASIEW